MVPMVCFFSFSFLLSCLCLALQVIKMSCLFSWLLGITSHCLHFFMEIIILTVPVKSLDTASGSMVVLFFLIFYFVNEYWRPPNYEYTILDGIIIRNFKPKFKVATFCFDDSFAHSCHSLNQLLESPGMVFN